MKPTPSQRMAGVLKLIVIFVLVFFSVDGCKKDSGPTGPLDPPTLPSVAGNWSGSGSYFDMGMGKRLNYSLVAGFNTTSSDNAFTGNLTSTWTDQGIYYTGDQWIGGIKGKFTLPKQITIAETSAVYSHRGVSGPITDPRMFSTYEGCALSTNGDTLSYSGPSPEFETYVLVKQK